MCIRDRYGTWNQESDRPDSGYPWQWSFDQDNDGVYDQWDDFPYDPTETNDSDGDGIGDNADVDDDGDGFSDFLEADCETDPLDYDSQPQDEDGDGVCNALDRIVIELYLIDDDAAWDSGETLIGDLETDVPSFGTLNDLSLIHI